MGGESGLAVVAAPANAYSLSSSGMVCDGSKLFSPAPHISELFLN